MERSIFGIGTGAFVGERDDWPAALRRARSEGWRIIELTAITEARLATLAEYLNTEVGTLERFERVSVHAPNRFASSPSRVAELASTLPIKDVVLHPDLYLGERAIEDLGERAIFENMDVTKPFGCTVSDMTEVFRRFPSAGFCLDIAHVWTHDQTLRLGFEMLERFGARLRQIHLSGIELDGTHRTTTEADLARYEPILARCGGVPWILESELVDAT